MNKNIIIKNAYENNLKNIDLEIEKNKITIFTGVSGSGKSSIVFDVLAQESTRLLNETYSAYIRRFLPKYTRPKVETINNLSMCVVVDQKSLGSNSRSTVGSVTDINSLLRLLYSRFSENSLGSANYYSFNDPSGMCLTCEGIGSVTTLDIQKALDFSKSLNEGAILLPQHKVGSWMCKVYLESGFFDNDKKIKDYTKDELDQLLYGEGSKIEMKDFNLTYEGIVVKFIRQNINNANEKTDKSKAKISEYTTSCICETCNGRRFNQNVYKSTIDKYDISMLLEMEINLLIGVISDFKINGGQSLIDEIKYRLESINHIGIGYLSLSRQTGSLSGGEAQRIKMVKHLSSSLTDVLYIFDEPSTGLHPRDVHLLNEMLLKLRDSGNTIIVVEHDPDVIKIADNIVDVGPKAGKHGGTIQFNGTYKELLKTETLTAKGLNNEVSINMETLKFTEFLESSKSTINNLKNVSLKVAKNHFNVVTGVAGSGKSTLVNQVFFKEFENIVRIDQKAVHTTKRSSPATFVSIMDDIRKLFSKENDIAVGHFSNNSIGGCDKCGGNGEIELNLSFMEATSIVCDECDGNRFKKEVLKYKFNNLNILEVLNLSVDEAIEFFELKKIKTKLEAMKKVGLGYITLAQPLNTLSGGEVQRLKLAVELNKKGNIYILDEPTTGLHMSDVNIIIDVINELTKKQNTVIVIEHNIDVIKHADYIIDIGPNGGNNGGEIIFNGQLKDVLKCSKSITAKYLK